MSHSAPVRPVKCQVCDWAGVRRYSAGGILIEPCPAGHRVTYAVIYPGDQPTTPDTGEIRQPSQKRVMAPEHRAKVLAALAAARARRSAA
jgi:hypothetical protein